MLFWNRTLDLENNLLVRSVKQENSKGDVSEFTFKRFASFANDHFYVMEISVKPENYSKKICINSGINLRTKSNGFKMTDIENIIFEKGIIKCNIKTRGKYNHCFNIGVCHNFVHDDNISSEKFLTQSLEYNSTIGEEKVFEKKICVVTSRDVDDYSVDDGIQELMRKDFLSLFKEHQNQWKEFFGKNDIKTEDADAGVEAALNADMEVLAVGYAKSNPKATYCANDLKEAISVLF